MSTGRTCFEHLVMDTCQLIGRLNDFDQTQSKLALERCQRLEAQLAESQRRERAAVEDMVYAIFNLDECVVCKNPCNKERPKDGGRFEPLYKQGCGTWMCGNFEWRGPHEAGKGEPE